MPNYNMQFVTKTSSAAEYVYKKHHALKIFLLTLLYFSIFKSSGQNLPVKTLDINNGLSNNSVNSIYQDANGFMWFGSYDGLNRYDGYQCKVYRNIIGDTLSLRSNNINCIEGDHKKNIWVGGYNGVSVLDLTTDKFKTLYYNDISKKKKLPLMDIVYQIRYVSNSLMLVGTQNNGLISFENGKWTGAKVPLHINGKMLKTYDVSAIELNPNQNFCWVFVNKIGLCRYSLSSKKLEVFSDTVRQANCLLSSGSGTWIGSDDGLYLLDDKGISKNHMQKKYMVTTLSKDAKNNIWIGTDGYGIFSISGHNGAAVPFRDNSGMAKSNSITDSYRDAANNMWFSTLRGGVLMLAASGTDFKHVFFDKGSITDLSKNFIVSFAEDIHGNLWLGTDGGGLRYWNRKNNSYTEYSSKEESPLQLSSNFVPCLQIDHNNNLWLAMWGGGINKIDSRRKSVKYYHCYNPNTGANEENVWFIYEDSKKNLWANTARNGHLFKYDSQSDSFRLFYGAALDISCMTETQSGGLWAGNRTSIFLISPESRKFKSYPTGHPVRCMAEAGPNLLWVGTDEGGLMLYNTSTGTYNRYTVADGLPSNTILKIVRDRLGSLWLSTYNGLCRFEPGRKTFRNFTAGDGLQSNQFSYNAGLALSTGELVFGGINGFNIFYPAQIKNHTGPKKIVVTGILVDNQPIEKKINFITERESSTIKTITVPYEQANLSIDFASIDFKNSDKTIYAYLMEGWDKDWNYPGKVHKAGYTRLREGTYTFKVKTADGDGTWINPVSMLQVVVTPPWYRTITAYVVYLILAAGMLYLYIKYNNNKQKLHYEIQLAKLESKKEKELAEKQLTAFTYISHEFRTPISLIINPLKQSILNNIDGKPLKENLAVAYRNARRLLSLVDQLMLFRQAESGMGNLKVNSFDLPSLCEEIYNYFEYLAKEKQIKFEFHSSAKSITMYGDYEKLEIVLFNLLSNAFKFTPKGGTIKISVKNGEKEASIIISDSGSGIENEKIGHIFEKFYRARSKSEQNIGFGVGLFIVKQFIESHRGTVNCTSTLDQGTSFKVTLPKGHGHFTEIIQDDSSKPSSILIEELLGNDLAQPEQEEPVQVIEERMLTTKKSVVIVEDDEEMRKYLINLFSEYYLVYSAADGIEALELIKRILPDIIISDINMEHMDGLSLCHTVRETQELSHIPVILLTAATKQTVQLQGISSGADDYITKPFENEILLAKVDTLLKNRIQLRKYFLDNITLKENSQKVPVEYRNFLDQCIQIIEQNLDREDFTIKDFSVQMGMSHSSLYKKIKVISGQTTNAFIRYVRLRRAAVLMLTENITIAEAGAKVGIGDPRYFRRQFITLFGMTPSDYIKKYRNSFNKELNVIQSDLN